MTHAFEDVCYRLYAYQEKAFQLVNAALGAGFSERDTTLRDGVRKWLQEREEYPVLDLLESLSTDATIRDMVRQRHGFAHRLSPREIEGMKGLSGPRRFIEDLSWELLRLDEFDMLSASLDVDACRERLRQRLDRVSGALEKFEAELCRELGEALARRGWLREGDQ